MAKIPNFIVYTCVIFRKALTLQLVKMDALREPKLLKLEVRTPQITSLYSKSTTISLSNLCYNCIDYFIREDYNDVLENVWINFHSPEEDF